MSGKLAKADIVTPELYTSGQIAAMLGVSPRTVGKMVDAGHLRGWRIPGGQERRVKRCDLVQFFARNGLDVPRELGVEPVHLAFGLLPDEPGAAEPFEAYSSPVRLGAALRGADAVGLFAAGDGLGLSLALAACECCREWHPAARVALVAGPDAGAVACPAADAVFVRPVEWPAVLARLALPGRGK